MDGMKEGPPSYNMGGSNIPTHWKSKENEKTDILSPGMDFDWYQATIPGNPGHTARQTATRVIDVLERELRPFRIRRGERGQHGYTDRTEFLDARGGVEVTILHGGNPAPNIRATGFRAPAMAEVCRRLFPEHRVTRLDVAIDFCQGNAWNGALLECRSTMRRANMESGLLMLPDNESKGSTYYMGSKSSPVMARLYQKGLQMAGKFKDEEFPEDWVRLELQVRPAKKAKTTFAGLTPEECWGASKWAQDLYQRMTGILTPRRPVDFREPTEWERTQAHMMMQYGKHMFEGGKIAHRIVVGSKGWEDGVRAYMSAMTEQLIDMAKARISEGHWEIDRTAVDAA